MTADEFIRDCKRSYNLGKKSEEYVKMHPKTNYTIDDVICLNESMSKYWHNVPRVYGQKTIGEGCRTTAFNHIAGNSGERQDWWY